MGFPLPDLTPRDPFTAWYSQDIGLPTSSHNARTGPQFDSNAPDATVHGGATAATSQQHRHGLATSAASAASDGTRRFLRIIDPTKLRNDEVYFARRLENVRNYGSTWLKPPGVQKTLHQMREERREQEEQAEMMRREALAQELAEAAAAGEGGDGGGAAGTTDVMGGLEGGDDATLDRTLEQEGVDVMEVEEEHDLDEDIEEAEGLSFAASDSEEEEEESEEDSDEESDNSSSGSGEVSSQEGSEVDSSRLGVSKSSSFLEELSEEEAEEENDDGEEEEEEEEDVDEETNEALRREEVRNNLMAARMRITDDAYREALARGGAGLLLDEENFLDEDATEDFLDEDDITRHSGIASGLGGGGDGVYDTTSADFGMEANLDDEIPEAGSMMGSYEHTDSEAEVSSSLDGYDSEESEAVHHSNNNNTTHGTNSVLRPTSGTLAPTHDVRDEIANILADDDDIHEEDIAAFEHSMSMINPDDDDDYEEYDDEVYDDSSHGNPLRHTDVAHHQGDDFLSSRVYHTPSRVLGNPNSSSTLALGSMARGTTSMGMTGTVEGARGGSSLGERGAFATPSHHHVGGGGGGGRGRNEGSSTRQTMDLSSILLQDESSFMDGSPMLRRTRNRR